MPMIRKEPRSQSGWTNGDIDTLFSLFNGGRVWDGDLAKQRGRAITWSMRVTPRAR